MKKKIIFLFGMVVITVCLVRIVSFRWVRGKEVTEQNSTQLTMIENEEQELTRISRRFSSDLLEKNDFTPLFHEFFVEDYFDNPDRYLAELFGLDKMLIPDLDKSLIRRYIIGRWNIFWHRFIYVYSQHDPLVLQPNLGFPKAVQDYLNMNNIPTERIAGFKFKIENRDELTRITPIIEIADELLKQEIESKSLMKTDKFREFLKDLQLIPRKFKVTKRIISEPEFGLPPGTIIYRTEELMLTLFFIKKNNTFKIAVIGIAQA